MAALQWYVNFILFLFPRRVTHVQGPHGLAMNRTLSVLDQVVNIGVLKNGLEIKTDDILGSKSRKCLPEIVLFAANHF